jgi:hypothetical protein
MHPINRRTACTQVCFILALGHRGLSQDGWYAVTFHGRLPWQATVPGRGFFAIIRLYSPTEGAFDASWKPDDFALMK